MLFGYLRSVHVLWTSTLRSVHVLWTSTLRSVHVLWTSTLRSVHVLWPSTPHWMRLLKLNTVYTCIYVTFHAVVTKENTWQMVVNFRILHIYLLILQRTIYIHQMWILQSIIYIHPRWILQSTIYIHPRLAITYVYCTNIHIFSVSYSCTLNQRNLHLQTAFTS